MSRKLTPTERDYYSRNLPHWQPEGAVLFMTTRLYGSLPKEKIQELKYWKQEKEQLLKKQGFSVKELSEELLKCADLYLITIFILIS